MKCENCGVEIESGSAFCENCGKPVNGDLSEHEQQGQTATIGVSKTKKLPKKLIILLSAGAAVLIALISVIFILSNRVSVENYIDVNKIKVDGYSGYATVTSSLSDIVDYNGIDEALGFGIPSNKDNYEKYLDYFFEDALSSKKYIDINCDDSLINLKNGDVITITVNIDYDSINQNAAKKKLVGKETITLEYNVQELKEPQKIDPFSCIEKVFVNENEDYIELKYKFKEDNDFTACGYNVSYNSNGSINVMSPDENTGFDVTFMSDTILDNVKKGEKVNIIAKTYNNTEQSGIELLPENKEIESEFIYPVKDESKIDSSNILAIKEKIEEISESVVASQYYEYDFNEESKKFEFARITFLVKNNNVYNLYGYDASSVRISESNEIFMNSDDLYRIYYSYGKIKDYETENTNQWKKIKRITLAEN